MTKGQLPEHQQTVQTSAHQSRDSEQLYDSSFVST